MKKEELIELRDNCYDSQQEMNKLEKEKAIIPLAEELNEFIQNLEVVKERGKQLEHAGVSPRIKLMRKGIRMSKDLKNFEKKIVDEFTAGNITEAMGKKLVSVLKLIKSDQLPVAKEEFKYFDEILELNKEYTESKKEVEKADAFLKKEQNRIKKLLEDIKELENQVVDTKKVRKYEQLLKYEKSLKDLRKNYIHSLLSGSVLELLNKVEKNSFEKYSFPKIEKDNSEQLKIFFSEHSELGKYNLKQLCSIFDYSEKKLSHIFPETSRFKRIVLNNREWFENLHTLEHTSFISPDNENSLDFYSKFMNAGETINKILEIKQDGSIKEEYEKNKRIEERKKELSKYSKHGLENELNENKYLSELLHSESAPLEEAEKPEQKGFLSKIGSLFGLK